MSLKNSMKVMGNQSPINTIVFDEVADQAASNNEIAPQNSMPNFARKTLMTPTMIMNTFLNIDKEISQ
jgi:hypothetical protein